MTITIDKCKDHYTIKIDHELTIYEVETYRKELLEQCDLTCAAMVQLSEDIELDTAGIQLLLSLQKQLQSAGKDVTVQATGAQAIHLFDVFNLSNQFNLNDKDCSYD